MVRAILDGQKYSGGKLYTKKGFENSLTHLARRLGKAIEVNPKSGCWEWQQSHNGIGYGTLTINKKRKYAHRLAFELVCGSIPSGLMLCHKCDNPSCINPEHLFLGTQTENMKDCSIKGRLKPYKLGFPGEKNPSAKLNEEKVSIIKERLRSGELQSSIANYFGVTQSVISEIKRGKLWALVK